MEDFLATVQKEGEPAFESGEKETPAPSQGDNKPEKETPPAGVSTEDENKLPFHEHPRWKAREQELKELREQEGQFKKTIEDLAKFKEDTESKFKQFETTSKVPDWFKELYGENASAWEKYQTYDRSLREGIKAEVLQAQETQRKEQEREITKWNKWVDDEIGKLKSSGKEFDRNELIKTVLDFRPTDEQGNYDFNAAYRIMETMKLQSGKEKSDAKKRLGDTGKDKGDSKVTKDYLTPSDLRNKSWSSIGN